MLLIAALFILVRARSGSSDIRTIPVTEVSGEAKEALELTVVDLPSVTLDPSIVHEGWLTLGDGDDIYDVALSQNYIWAATGSGLVRWDTTGEFTRIGSEHGLGSGRARTIAIAPDGAVWIGSLGSGLSVWQNGTWSMWTIANGLPSSDIYDIEIAADGTVWVATGNGVVEINNGNLNAIAVGTDLNNQLISDILIDSDGVLWAINQLGLFKRDPNSAFVPVAGETIFETSLPSAIGLDGSGQLWVGTFGGQLYTLIADTWAPDAFSGVASEKITAIVTDANNTLWVATEDGVFSQTETDWEKLTTETLPSENVRALVSDAGAGIWFGTRKGLVSKIGPQFRTYVTEDGLESNLIQDLVITEDGVLWAATFDGGIANYDADDGWQSITVDDGLVTNDIWTLATGPDDALWLGTQDSGVMVFTDDDIETYTVADGLANNTIYAIAPGPNDDPWLSTAQQGLYRFSDEFTPQSYEGRGNVFDLAFDDTNTLRTAIFDGELIHAIDTGSIWRPAVDPTASPSEKALSIAATDSGDLWIGTAGGGALHFDGLEWNTFTDATGLAHNIVWAIQPDAAGNIWLGTGNGISVYDGDTWTTFTTADGLSGNEVRELYFDKKGILFAATSAGVSQISTTEVFP